MSEFNQSQTTDSATLQRRAYRTAAITLAVTVGLFIFYLITGWQFESWQLFVLAGTFFAYGVTLLVSMRLIRAGRVNTGTWVYVIGLFPIGPIGVLVVTDISLIVALVMTIMIFVTASQGLPNKQVRRATAIGIGIAILDILLDQLPLDYRLTLPLIQTVIPIAGGTVVVGAAFFVFRRMWNSGRLRNRIIVTLVGVLTPVLIISTIFTAQAQRQDLEQLLFERAEASAITGAKTISHLLEDAIANGILTEEQVFDTNYIKFFEFDPATDPDYDPEIDGAPENYDKYHTAYDDYTDANWQELLDTYLTQTDIIFAGAIDRNGYIPTHNTIYSSGDGSIATDRTKRIFNDPVGLAAAQNTEPILQQVYEQSGTGETFWDVSAPIYVNGEHWGAFRVGIQLGENQERVIAATWRSVIAATLTIAVLVGATWSLGNYISIPLESLTNAATQAAEGDLNQRIEIPNRDEITILAQAFTSMIIQLSELVTSLEQRITERTRALETSTQVGRRLSTILDQRQLVREVVEQVQTAFDYYHAHIYIFDEEQENLIMAGGTGEAGQAMLRQGHYVPKGRGLVGQAGDTNLPILVPDVSQAEGWLPNPLLPDTRAEVAIPIATGETVLGVLDVQDNEVGGLNEDDVDLLQSIANQVAAALLNARTYQQTQQQVARDALIANINQQIQSTTDIEDALQIAVRELGRALDTDTSVRLTAKERE